MTQKNPALQLFRDILADVRDPDFVWQVLALAGCLSAAWLIERWWRARHEEGAGRLRDAGSRLAFPLCAMLLVGAARLALDNFIHVNLLKLAMPLLGSLALVRAVVFVLRQAFPRATWLTTWERIIATLVWGWLALYITDLLPHVIDALERVDFVIGRQHVNLWVIIHGLLTVSLTVIVALWIAGIIEARLMRVQTLDSSVRMVAVRVAKALLTVAAIVTSLSLAGIDMTAFSVFTGALGVSLGIGLQKIASNYVSGFIILLDHSIRIGDVIQVGTDRGEVRKITTRYTVLRAGTGSHYLLPNETLVGSVVLNDTFADPRVRVATRVQVAYDADVERAMALMEELARAEARVIADPPPRADLISFDDSGITLELGFWIADPENGNQEIRSNINRGILRRFREAGIEIPFPQREVRLLNPQ